MRSGTARGRRPWLVPFIALFIAADLLPLAVQPPAAQAASSIFPAGTPFSITSEFGRLGAGDLDSDGDLDIVQGVSLLLNNGSAAPFDGASATPIGTNAQEGAIAIADFDGDGHLDIILCDRLFLNNRSAAPFSGVTGTRIGDADLASTPFGDPNGQAALGDLDGDGRLDVVLGGKVYLNSPAATPPFQGVTGTQLVGATASHPVAIGRLDADDRADIVVGRQIYLNQGGAAPFQSVTPTLIGGAAPETSAVTLGDLDGDGRLDAVVGYPDRPAELFLNTGAAAPFATAVATPVGGATSTVALALGDVELDGDLDMLLIPTFNPLAARFPELLLNTGTATPFAGVPAQTIEIDRVIRSVALADFDGDADVDFALGVSSAVFADASRLYLNAAPATLFPERAKTVLSDGASAANVALGDLTQDGRLDLVRGGSLLVNGGDAQPFGGPASVLVPAADAASVAIGDLNGDGAQDLVIGHADGPPDSGRTFLSNGTSAPFAGVAGQPIGTAKINARQLALGDVNGDGRLDLLVSGVNVLLNNGTSAPFAGVTPAPILEFVSGVTPGDLDGDGDLDLAVVQSTAGILTSDGSGAPFAASPFQKLGVELDTDPVNATAIGDLDGDGDPDIVVAGASSNSAVYLNNGTAAPFNGVTALALDTAITNAGAVAIGDLDGDGDSDLVFSGAGALPSWVLLNSGGARPFVSARARPLDGSSDGAASGVALGDVDADGDLDLVRAVSGAPTRLHRNALRDSPRLQNSAPAVSFVDPARLDRADFFASPRLQSAATVTIPYRLSDAEGDPVRLVRAFYSLDGGGSWTPAVPDDATQTTRLAAPPSGATHTFIWRLFADTSLFPSLIGQSANVVFRIEAFADVSTNGVLQRAWSAATSYPFSVRGVVPRVIDGAGAPVAGALVFALPPDQAPPASALPARRAQDAQLGTDRRGFLAGRGAIRAGDALVALRQVGSTEHFTLYHSSAAPTPAGLAGRAVTQTGVQTLTVSPDNPLALLNLTVSLEWDARGDAVFLARLRDDLRRTSALLYDWTDGQVALGAVTIFHSKARWYDVRNAQGRITQKGADLRIYATNRLRPSASQGGIVAQDTADPDVPDQVYEPGAVRIGAVWNRDGSPVELVASEDWARALAHEIGHYALYLDDNYLGLDSAGRLLQVEGCRSAMSDPYRDDYSEFHPAAGWGTACAQTLSQRTTGRSDWQTIDRFTGELAPGFRLRPPASFNANSGPSALPLAVTQFSEVPASGSAAPSASLRLRTPQGAPVTTTSAARAVLLSADGAQLVDLGQPAQGQVLARGALPTDRVCVFDLPAGQLGCAPVGARTLTVQPRVGWRPDVVITDVTSRSVTLSVPSGGVGLPAPAVLQARVFPLDSTQAPQSVTLVRSPDGTVYRGALSFGELVAEAAIHVFVPGDSAPAREIVTEYALGGNPAPIRRPRPRSRRRSPMTSPDGSMVLFADTAQFAPGQFFAIQTATALPPDPANAAAIAPGYRLLVSDPALLQQPLGLTLSYAESDLPPGIEDGIAVYYQPPGGAWTRLATQLDTEDNEAVAQGPGPGLYALMASFPWQLDRIGLQQVYYPGADAPLPAALTPIRGSYRLIYGYDDGDADDPWKVYAPDAPAWVNDLAALRFEQPYWLSVRSPLVAPVKPAPKATTLLPPPPALFYGVLAAAPGFTPRAGMVLEAWVGDTLCASTSTQQAGSEIVWSIDVPAATDEATFGCGARGRTVRFLVGDHWLPLALPWDNTLVNGTPEPSLFLPLMTR